MTDFYRFNKEKTVDISVTKGETSWYKIFNRADDLLYRVHVIGGCLGGITRFYAAGDEQRVVFSLQPKRKLLNFTYYVFQGDGDLLLATLKLQATRGLRAFDLQRQELFRIVDPRKTKQQLLEAILGGWCGEYALTVDKIIIGSFNRQAREESSGAQKSGLLNRLKRGVLNSIVRDWCLEISTSEPQLNPEVVLSAAILLQAQSIRLDQCN